MEKQTLTVEEVVRLTVDMLGAIQIPVALSETVGFPITQAIANLRECVRAMEEQRVAQEVAKEPVEEVKEDEREAEAE